VAIALGDVRGGEAALFADHFLTFTGAGNPMAALIDNTDQADSIADCADTHLTSSLAERQAGCGGAGLGAECGKRGQEARD
jgi:hypothetical protein